MEQTPKADAACARVEATCTRLVFPESDEIMEELPAVEVDGEFEIVLDKTSGNPLGIDIVYWKDNTLLVEGVAPGLVSDWNRRHPSHRVKVGDVIFSVNGVSGDMHRLVDECTKKSVLRVSLRRGGLKLLSGATG